MTELMARYCSNTTYYHHYSHMAWGNYREYLKGDEVRTKKHFYVLRPLLAMLWIEKGMGIVPTTFQDLVEEVLGEGTLKKEIIELLERKRGGLESEKGPRLPVISDFIEKELARLKKAPPAFRTERRDYKELNRFFLSFLD
jgi:predicted nucleotidyltransferase